MKGIAMESYASSLSASSTKAAVEPKSQVAQAIIELEKSREQLGELVRVLESRLESVLHPESPSKAGECEARERMVPLAEYLSTIADNYQVIAGHLADIMHRLEL